MLIRSEPAARTGAISQESRGRCLDPISFRLSEVILIRGLDTSHLIRRWYAAINQTQQSSKITLVNETKCFSETNFSISDQGIRKYLTINSVKTSLSPKVNVIRCERKDSVSKDTGTIIFQS